MSKRNTTRSLPNPNNPLTRPFSSDLSFTEGFSGEVFKVSASLVTLFPELISKPKLINATIVGRLQKNSSLDIRTHI
ncbi:calcium-dependent lipid-binding family protein [Trifolium repens]|nr:calcium-dependent lipid-binding family protein [Trifolium repens]